MVRTTIGSKCDTKVTCSKVALPAILSMHRSTGEQFCSDLLLYASLLICTQDLLVTETDESKEEVVNAVAVM